MRAASWARSRTTIAPRATCLPIGPRRSRAGAARASSVGRARCGDDGRPRAERAPRHRACAGARGGHDGGLRGGLVPLRGRASHPGAVRGDAGRRVRRLRGACLPRGRRPRAPLAAVSAVFRVVAGRKTPDPETPGRLSAGQARTRDAARVGRGGVDARERLAACRRRRGPPAAVALAPRRHPPRTLLPALRAVVAACARVPAAAMTCGDLFAGIGGMSLGLERAGFTVRWQVEREPYCENVLARHWPDVARRRDVRFAGAGTLERVDLIAGGFPCQDVSAAGKGGGLAGHRSGLWREFACIVRELRPRWVLVENVPALRRRGADTVLGDLEAAGYTCWPCVVGARHVGAPHRRDRVWIVGRLADDDRAGCAVVRRGGLLNGERAAFGHDVDRCDRAGVADAPVERERTAHAEDAAECQGRAWEDFSGGGVARVANSDGGHLRDAREPRRGGGQGGPETAPACRGRAPAAVGQADGNAAGLEGRRVPRCERADKWPAGPGSAPYDWEEPRTVESPVGRATHGVSSRLASARWRDELRALGNAVVPQVVEVIGRAIMAVESCAE